jgi:hypothetical protein
MKRKTLIQALAAIEFACEQLSEGPYGCAEWKMANDLREYLEAKVSDDDRESAEKINRRFYAALSALQ